MLTRNNRHRILTIALGIVLLCLASVVIAPRSVFAETTVKKSQVKKVADFTLKYSANAGGALTNTHYVVLDTRGSHGGNGTLLKIYNRKTCKLDDTQKLSTSYLSGAYNEPNTNKITLIAKGHNVGCYKISGSKIEHASGCNASPGGYSLSYEGTAQGNAIKYHNHAFRVAGYSGGKIRVWGSGTHDYVIPNKVISHEPENITVDAKSGEIYVNYASSKNGKKHSLWYKFDAKLFSKYTGKSQNTNPVICKNTTASGGTTTETTTSGNNARKKEGTLPGKYDTSGDGYTPGEDTYDGTVDTLFFGTLQDDGEGCGVYTVMSLIITIMSVGIGIVAVIGIAVSGIFYLTAGGNVEKTTKAKRRIYEIVIGLAAYAVLTALLAFLLPEFNPELKACQAPTSEETTAGDTEPEETTAGDAEPETD